MNFKIAAIVPAYNEQRSIAQVVQEINETSQISGLKIDAIVVNDCSSDETSKIISSVLCVPLNLPINLGIGGAVQTGFRYALENNYDFAVQVDGDGQHPTNEIPNLIFAAQKNNWDVAIGSRFINKEGFQSSLARRTGIGYFMWLNKFLVNKKITDSTSGFRLLNKKALEIVCDYYPDEYPEPEAIILFAKNNLTIGEIPVVMRERQGGVSSIGSAKSMYYMVKVTLAILSTFIRTKKI